MARQKLSVVEIEDALKRHRKLAPEISYLLSTQAKSEEEAARASCERVLKDKEQAENLLRLAIERESAEREADKYAAHLNSLVEHGSALGLQDGHCPLCAAYRSADEFNEAIDSAKKRLAERGERLTQAARSVADAKLSVEHLSSVLAAEQGKVAALEVRRTAAEKETKALQDIYKRNGIDVTMEDPETAQQNLMKLQERLVRLERALFILDASSAIDRVNSLQSRIVSLREVADREAANLANAEQAVETARQIESSAKVVANQILTEQFDTVMPLLKELYRRLRPHADWREIESDFGGKVRASLNFTVGSGHNVQFLFSSGQRRAAGLAFLLTIHMSRRWCQLQSLLLDDPVQHIDDYRALNLVEVLAAIRRTNRQVIVAVEDTALADLLCRRLRSSTGDIGRRFEMHTDKTGTAAIESVHDIYPMPREVLRSANAS